MSKNPKAIPRRSVGRPRKEAAQAAPVLDRAQIVGAALALIDEQGLPALTIRALAQRLGVAPSAVYWHVSSRDELLSGAVALALGGVAQGLAGGTWRERLAALLRRFRAVLREHPQLASVVATQMTYNDAFDLPLVDHVVEALEDARFDGPDLVDAFNVVIAALCGFATLELCAAPTDSVDAWAAACRERVDGVDPVQHPHLARHGPRLRNRAFMLRWVDGAEQPLDGGFEAWIDVFIRGLESRSRALRRAPGAQSSA